MSSRHPPESLFTLLKTFVASFLLSGVMIYNASLGNRLLSQRPNYDVGAAASLLQHRMKEVTKPSMDVVAPLINIPTRFRVAKKHRINTCVIEKNLSTVLTAIMCFLYDPDNFRKQRRNVNDEEFHLRLCAGRNEQTRFDDATDAFNETKANPLPWLNLAVSRDPVERFVSGFVDKCLTEKIYRNRPGTCNGCRKNVECFLGRQYWRMKRYASAKETSISFDDQHFHPQNWRCEFGTHFANYTILKYSSRPNGTKAFFHELFAHFRRQGVSESEINFLYEQVQSRRTEHATVNSSMRKKFEQQVRSSPKMMKQLVKMYYYDFVLFGYPIPQF